MKIVVVGGVAGGMSFAARARRLAEDAEIVVLERDPYVSYANCGLPYHLGGEIGDRDALLLHTPQSLAESLALDVRTGHEVLAIDPAGRTVAVRECATGRDYPRPMTCWCCRPGPRRSSRQSRERACPRSGCCAPFPMWTCCVSWWTAAPAGQ